MANDNKQNNNLHDLIKFTHIFQSITNKSNLPFGEDPYPTHTYYPREFVPHHSHFLLLLALHFPEKYYGRRVDGEGDGGDD